MTLSINYTIICQQSEKERTLKKALLIIDVQNDFCPGGALAVPNGNQVVAPLNRAITHAMANSWLVVASRDWHPSQTIHFKEFGGLWPVHCVQNTSGAEFHPSLNLPEGTIVVSKGMNNQDDGYSLFEGVNLRENDWPLSLSSVIMLYNCREVYVGGLATDYCVKATALDAVKKGFKTYLLLDACRAVNVNPGDGIKALSDMINAGVEFVTTDEVIRG